MHSAKTRCFCRIQCYTSIYQHKDYVRYTNVFILGMLDNAQYKINYLVYVLILISGAGHYSNSVHKSVTAQSAL